MHIGRRWEVGFVVVVVVDIDAQRAGARLGVAAVVDGLDHQAVGVVDLSVQGGRVAVRLDDARVGGVDDERFVRVALDDAVRYPPIVAAVGITCLNLRERMNE